MESIKRSKNLENKRRQIVLELPRGVDDLGKYRKWETLAYAVFLPVAECKGAPALFEAPLME